MLDSMSMLLTVKYVSIYNNVYENQSLHLSFLYLVKIIKLFFLCYSCCLYILPFMVNKDEYKRAKVG